MKKRILMIVLLCLLGMVAVRAQSSIFEIVWYTIDGGGKTSSNANFTLRGSIGQPDAGLLVGSAVRLRGGFASYPAPVIISPEGIAPGINFYQTPVITLTWARTSWALGYHVQVSTSTSFSNIIFEDDTLPETADSIATLPLSDGTYYWRVRAKWTETTWGLWSPYASFIINVP
jgi:hypothetical protein